MAYFVLFVDADPIMFETTSKHEKWKVAMDNKLDAILKNKTWERVDLLEGKKPLDVKWMYKTKLNSKGEVDKQKAHLVVKGYKQSVALIFRKFLHL